MADSGIYHIAGLIPVTKDRFEDEAFHALAHGTSSPVSPVERQLFYRDDLHKLYIYNGSAWIEATVTAVALLNDIGDVNVPTPTDDDILYWDDAASKWQDVAHLGVVDAHHAKYTNAEAVTAVKADASLPVVTITFIIDGGGEAITTGQKGHLEIPFACTINRVTMLADQSGSIVVDIWKDTYANFPPDNADSITASAPPTITTAQKAQDDTLTGWTTTIVAGDILAFNVDSCTTIERVTISLKVTKS